ncbi:extracellular membrane associated protein with a signal peptide [Cryptosporidium ryanae]|uniref:extracellular membrane associated protein with a signal peptide n=1 Tax=Cryptosporidium ryanae TaxID=515981 RepID=UPI00351A35CF|nr:extracellular membrane associated protein with a signal peptide [Cryptosporidium ryanae]
MANLRSFFIIFLSFVFCLHLCFSEDAYSESNGNAFEGKNEYFKEYKNEISKSSIEKTVEFNCKDLFESIYFDKNSRNISKLLFYLGTFDKYEEILKSDGIVVNDKKIRLEKMNINSLIPYEHANILFEGKNIKENKIDLGECRVNKKTGIPFFNIGESLLHSAVISGKLNIVILLILSEINANIKLEKLGDSTLSIVGSVGGYIGDLEGMTPLHYVSLIQDLESIEIAKVLLKHGADPNVRDKYKRTPLHTAGLSRNLHPKKMVKILLDAGANPKKKDLSKLTPLHFAVSRNNLPVVSLLVSSKNNRNMNEGLLEYFVDVNGNTPLHIAAMFNSGDVLPLLINNKNDPLIENFHGLSPLEISAFPVGYRALNSEDIQPFVFSVLLSNIKVNAHETSFVEKVTESYYRSIRGGYLQILEKILFLNGSNLNNSPEFFVYLDINKGISLTEGKHKKIANYLKSFGTNILCPNPPVVLNSNYKLSDTVVGNYIRVGDTVTYECFEEYKLIGHSTITCNLGDKVAFYIPDPPFCSINEKKDFVVANQESKHLFVLLLFGVIIIVLMIILVLILNSKKKN